MEDKQLPALIVYSPNRWDDAWTSRHRIACGLVERGWPTIYSTGPLSTWERGSESWRAAGLTGVLREDRGVVVDRPGRIEAFRPGSKLWMRAALARHTARLRHAVRKISPSESEYTAFVFHPKFWPNVEALQPSRVVYFAYDALSLSPGWDETLAECERRLVDHADLIVAYSANMFDYMPPRAAEIGKEMPTGVDFDHFVGAQQSTCPADLAAIPSPRIGYAGHINQKLDLVGMVDVVRNSPDLNFVFVGEAGPGNSGKFEGHVAETEAWSELVSMPNVYPLGPKTFPEVPAYMGHMDVNIMCYRLEGGWWQAGYPLKMHEYLAVGKPVVSTGLATIQPFGDVIDIVSGAAAWRSALLRAISDGGVGTVDQRREVARNNSWDVRLDNLDKWMRDLEL